MSRGPRVTGARPVHVPPPIQRVEHVMGMPVIVEVCDMGFDETVLDRVFAWLHFVDATFSTYRQDSDISRLNRGEIALADAHVSVQSVLRRCESLRRSTHGYFDVTAPMASVGGGVDPSGFVKGWAVNGAGLLLSRAGAKRWCVNAGGDICLNGAPNGRDSWRVGIQHPVERLALAAVLGLRSGAVATSGAYERGEHILDPHTGLAPEGVLSVTIVGQDLAVADAYATAAFAMGRAGAKWAATLPGHGAIVIFDDDTISYSAGVEAYLRNADVPSSAPTGVRHTASHMSNRMTIGGTR
ncbi:MAG TPA: FAD:protein FMN transferase [Solirubrobacteraceae bacterium]|nr:FAD:protein FMN transferase [Solirubrobacteraceae bacterium]